MGEFMKRWYNNGEKCSYFEEGTQPEGWVLGRIKWAQNNFEKLKQEVLNKYDINDIFSYYCTHTKTETCNKFNVSGNFLINLLNSFNLKKTQQQINETRKITNIKLFGEDNPFKSEEIKQKIKEQNLKRYGVENSSQREDVREKLKEIAENTDYTERTLKTKRTLLERYGDENYVNIEKCAETKLKLYGTASFNNPEKIKTTSIERYGKPSYSQTKAFKEKLKSISQDKWGVDSYFQTEEFKEKAQNTCLEKYGVKSYTQTEEYKNKVNKIREQKIDEDGYVKSKQLNHSPQFLEILYDRDKAIALLEKLNHPTRIDLANYLESSVGTIQNWLVRMDLRDYITQESTNSYERELQEIFKDLDFKPHCRILDNHKELDLYSDTYKIAIEFNGNYWHSDLNKSKDYHYRKSLEAQEKGIRLIHIYEYEWNDIRIRPIIESLIFISCGKLNERIYARDCEIREITNKEAKPFNDKNHLQGHRNAQVTYGLFYNNKLVQLMSFSKTRYNRNLKGDNDWEIIRGCPGSNNIVIGGVNKLFTHFIRYYNPDKVFSYCDFNKFDGKSYEAIGMKFVGYTGPDKTWIINDKAVKRNPKKYRELKVTSDFIIWGSGSKKYEWTNLNNINKGVTCG